MGVTLSGGAEEKNDLIATLQSQDYQILDLTDNEVAKLHIRYMVGGHAPGIKNEILYRFQFPERPGALLKFLNGMGEGWNISLFHYRNHGSDYGRILTGIQVPPEDRQRFQCFLEELSYEYWSESDNPAYKLFLNGQA